MPSLVARIDGDTPRKKILEGDSPVDYFKIGDTVLCGNNEETCALSAAAIALAAMGLD